MSQKIALLSLTVIAAAALTANTFVTAGGTVAAAAGDAHGVVVADAAIGDLVAVDVLGTSTVVAAAAIVVGDRVEVAAGGKATPLAAGIPVGRAVSKAAVGELVEVLLFQGSTAAYVAP